MFESIASLWRTSVRLARWPHQPGSVQEPGKERRVWIRSPALAKGPFPATPGEEDRLSARVRSVSRAALYLVVNRRFDPGALAIVEVPGVEPTPDLVLACVVQVAAQPDGDWALHCALTSELSDEDLQALGAKRVKASSSDRRLWMRFPCPARVFYDVITEAEPSRQPAQAQDISASGIGLVVRKPIALGALLNLELEGADGQITQKMLASVVRVHTRTDGRWGLGCNFIRELNDRELRDLV